MSIANELAQAIDYAQRKRLHVIRLRLEQAIRLLARIRNLGIEDDMIAGTCGKCGGPVYHRPGHPGEFDHDWSAHEELRPTKPKIIRERSKRRRI